MRRIAQLLLVATAAVTLSSCIVLHRSAMPAADRAPSAAIRYAATFVYRVERLQKYDSDLGQDGVLRVFRSENPFSATSEGVLFVPKQGLFVTAELDRTPAAGWITAFDRMSYLTLGLLPSWNLHDIHSVTYRVFIDGEQRQSFHYDVTRKTVTWIGLLPFAWINLLNTSLDDVMADTARRFFAEAAPLFQDGARTHASANP